MLIFRRKYLCDFYLIFKIIEIHIIIIIILIIIILILILIILIIITPLQNDPKQRGKSETEKHRRAEEGKEESK